MYLEKVLNPMMVGSFTVVKTAGVYGVSHSL